MRRAVVAVVVGALGSFGCATTGEQQKAEPKTEQQRVTNIGYFDLKNCWPGVVDLPKPVTKEALIGFLVSSRPEISECFVNPKHRGPEQTTRAVIAATVDQKGETYEVTGENLTPEGIECVKKVLTARGGIEALPEGAQPVQGQIDFQHKVGASPAVVLGINEASDVTGTLRLEMGNWCDCFEPWKTAPPKSFDGTVSLVKAQPTPTSVDFQPTEDATVQQVQACVREKVMPLNLPHSSEQLKVPMRVLLIHSGINEPLPEGVPPELQFTQLEMLRAQRAGDVAMTLGTRTVVGQAWDKLVADYKAQAEAAKKTKKLPSITLKQLQDQCAELLAADEAWIASLEKQLENEQRTLQFVQQRAQQDPAWQDVVPAAQKQVEGAQADLANAKKTREEDAAACPKARY